MANTSILNQAGNLRTTRQRQQGWHSRPHSRWPAIAVIAGLHLLGLYAALQVGAVRDRVAEAAPMFVSFITAPPAPKPQTPPPPEPAKPRPEQHLIASPKAAPSAMQAPPEPVHEQPVAQEQAPPEPPAPPAAAVTPPNLAAAYRDNPAPDYPPASMALKEDGTTTLLVRVAIDGHAAEVSVYKSSGHPRLDQAAISGVRKWRFQPAHQGDRPVEMLVLVPINFKLED